MKTTFGAGAALLLTTTSAYALGLDRSGQTIGALFEAGTYAELSFGYVMPEADGTDIAAQPTGTVTEDYLQFGFAYKQQINDQVSLALIFDQPYGADVSYPATSPVLGGTEASVDSNAISMIARYDFGNGFSAHGGVRYQTLEADVTFGGLAYGGLNGYNAAFDRGAEWGYLAGMAYERPDIALRVALTYFSEVDYALDTVERIGAAIVNPGSTTDITTPQAINLDFQTGIAADTLLFGQIRWAEYSEARVSPDFFGPTAPELDGSPGSITALDDGFAYSIGVGRRFSDQFSGSVSIGYEPEGDDDLVSPLAPTNGQYSLSVGGAYTMDKWELSGGIRYVWLGDAQPETGTPDVARADFTDNSALAIGLQVAYTY